MNKPLHFTSTFLNNFFVASDWHFNHAGPMTGVPLWKSRGYDSPSDMTDKIIVDINKQVSINDVIVFNGDFCLNTSEDQFNALLKNINCDNIYMLWGNHNSRVKTAYETAMFKKFGVTDFEAYPIRYENLIFVGNYLEVIVNGQHIVFSHYPITSWNSMSRGTWMCHGHCHGGLQPVIGGKAFDIGVESGQNVYSFEQLKTIMSDKPKLGDGGHH